MFLAILVGVATGLAVAAFEWVVARLGLRWVRGLPWEVAILCPVVGLALAAACLRWLADGASPSTADEYLRNYHERGRRLPLRPAVGRIAASAATLGLGGALGLEGPSIYMGAVIGSTLQDRAQRFFRREDAKVLLVAGAAAGVAAIFKAPLTGVLFALEVPYQRDFTARAVLPALMAAAASYVTFACFAGTDPLLRVGGVKGFSLIDLAGAAGIGLACGLGARLFARFVSVAKGMVGRGHTWLRVLIGGGLLAGIAALAEAAFDRPLTLGPGYEAIVWATQRDRPMALIALLAVLQAVAMAATLAGGGAGGLFIPLVVQGALLGRLLGEAFHVADATLFPLVGAAAFLGAGYRTPLAAAVFVAETTGRPGAVVPGLIATAIAQLVMGSRSVTRYQRTRRAGHMEGRLLLPATAAMTTDVPTVGPELDVAGLVSERLLTGRQDAVAVLDGDTYLGLVRRDRVAGVAPDARARVRMRDIMAEGEPVVPPTWSLREVVEALEDAGTDCLPVVDGGRLLGMVTLAGVVRLDVVLAETDESP